MKYNVKKHYQTHFMKPILLLSQNQTKTSAKSNVVGLGSHDKEKAHKGGMEIGSKPKT
jgi:hypothetical protein